MEARPPSRTMPIAALSALPPLISSKWLAFTLKPRSGSSWMRKVRSRTGMPMQRMRGTVFIGSTTLSVLPPDGTGRAELMDEP